MLLNNAIITMFIAIKISLLPSSHDLVKMLCFILFHQYPAMHMIHNHPSHSCLCQDRGSFPIQNGPRCITCYLLHSRQRQDLAKKETKFGFPFMSDSKMRMLKSGKALHQCCSTPGVIFFCLHRTDQLRGYRQFSRQCKPSSRLFEF